MKHGKRKPYKLTTSHHGFPGKGTRTDGRGNRRLMETGETIWLTDAEAEKLKGRIEGPTGSAIDNVDEERATSRGVAHISGAQVAAPDAEPASGAEDGETASSGAANEGPNEDSEEIPRNEDGEIVLDKTAYNTLRALARSHEVEAGSYPKKEELVAALREAGVGV